MACISIRLHLILAGHVEYVYKGASQFERSEMLIGTYSELTQVK